MSAAPDPGRRADEQVLVELEEALSEQLALARGNQLDACQAATDRVEKLLHLAREIPEPISPAGMERVKRIDLLYRRLGLTIAQRKAELGGQIKRLRQGRTTLRAYGGGTAR